MLWESFIMNNEQRKRRYEILKKLVLANFSDVELTLAEKDMIANAALGISEGCQNFEEHITQKDEQNKYVSDNLIRAEILKYLCADQEAHKIISPRGIHVNGHKEEIQIRLHSNLGLVASERRDLDLDLDSCTIPFTLYFKNCHFPNGIQFRDAHTKMLAFPECNVSKIRMDRAIIEGDVWLNRSFSAQQGVSMNAARITGNVICEGNFHSDRIEESRFNQIAFSANNSIINGSLDIRKAKFNGICDLNYAKLTTLLDGKSCWFNLYHKEKTIKIIGLEYDRLGEIDNDDERWRDKLFLKDVTPPNMQPYEQLIKIYRSVGEDKRADAIAIQKNDKMFFSRFKSKTEKNRFSSVFSKIYSLFKLPYFFVIYLFWNVLLRHGYRSRTPIFLVAIFLWFFSVFYFWQAAKQNMMAPANPVIYLDNQVYVDCKDNWTGCQNSKMKTEYTNFNPIIYATDLLLPVIPFGQETSWTPKVENWSIIIWNGHSIPIWKYFSVFLAWLNVFMGWFISLFFGAIASGFIRKD